MVNIGSITDIVWKNTSGTITYIVFQADSLIWEWPISNWMLPSYMKKMEIYIIHKTVI